MWRDPFLRTAGRLAARHVRQHALRSLLSVSGVSLGVASVVVILAVAEGTRREIVERFSALGLETIVVSSRNLSQDERAEASRRHAPGLVASDARELLATRSELVLAVPESDVDVDVVHGAYRGTRRVLAAGADVFEARSIVLKSGRAFGRDEEAERSPNAVLSERLWRDVGSPPDDPRQPATLRLGDQVVRVSGVYGSAVTGDRAGGVAGDEVPDVVVPISLASSLGVPLDGAFEPSLSRIVLRVAPGADVLAAADAVERDLLSRRGGLRTFEVVSPLRLLREKERANARLTAMLGLLGTVSLAVGGIGILNVMLASLSERRREIGIQRALGATRRQVKALFLAESSLLSLLGGVAGLVAGILVAMLAGRIAGLRVGLAPAIPAVALATALAVGILSGLYPARQAAGMDPVDAMRI